MTALTAEVRQEYSDWQRGLLPGGGEEEEVVARQAELHDAVYGGSTTFAQYLRHSLKSGSTDGIAASTLPRRLTSSEFRDLPFNREREIYTALRGDVQPREASQPLFWTLCHIAWLESDSLPEDLDEALLLHGRDKTAEQRTRNLLRRIGGLAHVRGKISVLVNCPVARAWWRGHVAWQASEYAGAALSELDAHRVLQASNSAWEKLAGDSVHRITAANHPSFRAALIHQFADMTRQGPENVSADQIQRTAQVMARHNASVAFDLLSWTEMASLAASANEQARAELKEEEERKRSARAKASSTGLADDEERAVDVGEETDEQPSTGPKWWRRFPV